MHTDVAGPFPVNSLGGSRYYLIFVDDFSRYTTIYFLKRKSDVYSRFVEFYQMCCTWKERPVKFLRSDNGGEFVNKRMNEFCKEKGIQRQLTMPYTPEQNGVSERMNRTIMNKTRSMLKTSGLPQRYWAEACGTAVYLINRTPSTSLENKTPYEVWNNDTPSTDHLRTFVCLFVCIS